jgi:hypothetical protein
VKKITPEFLLRLLLLLALGRVLMLKHLKTLFSLKTIPIVYWPNIIQVGPEDSEIMNFSFPPLKGVEGGIFYQQRLK